MASKYGRYGKYNMDPTSARYNFKTGMIEYRKGTKIQSKARPSEVSDNFRIRLMNAKGKWVAINK